MRDRRRAAVRSLSLNGVCVVVKERKRDECAGGRDSRPDKKTAPAKNMLLLQHYVVMLVKRRKYEDIIKVGVNFLQATVAVNVQFHLAANGLQ